MTPVERLQAAIEKLETLRADSPYIVCNGWLAEPNIHDTSPYPLGPREDLIPVTNDELLVTLCRTLDAQLDVLRSAAAYGPMYVEPVKGDDPSIDSALLLAAAILGGTE